MAMKSDKSLEGLLCELSRRRRWNAIAWVAACAIAAVSVVFFAAVWADARFVFSGWNLLAIDLLFIVIFGVVRWRVRVIDNTTRLDRVAAAANLESHLALKHSELTNAVELRSAGESAASGSLRDRAVLFGDDAVRAVEPEAVVSPRSGRRGVLLLVVITALSIAIGAAWHGQVRATALRLLCPWSDEPAYSGLEFSASWSAGEARTVEVTARGVAKNVFENLPAEPQAGRFASVKSGYELRAAEMADVVWVRRSWWRGVGAVVGAGVGATTATGLGGGAISAVRSLETVATAVTRWQQLHPTRNS